MRKHISRSIALCGMCGLVLLASPLAVAQISLGAASPSGMLPPSSGSSAESPAQIELRDYIQKIQDENMSTWSADVEAHMQVWREHNLTARPNRMEGERKRYSAELRGRLRPEIEARVRAHMDTWRASQTLTSIQTK